MISRSLLDEIDCVTHGPGYQAPSARVSVDDAAPPIVSPGAPLRTSNRNRPPCVSEDTLARVLSALARAPRAMTAMEVVEVTRVSESGVRASLRILIERERVTAHTARRDNGNGGRTHLNVYRAVKVRR